jgi:hypothetical protein
MGLTLELVLVDEAGPISARCGICNASRSDDQAEMEDNSLNAQRSDWAVWPPAQQTEQKVGLEQGSESAPVDLH